MILKIAAVLVVLVLVYILFFKKNREQDTSLKKSKKKQEETDVMVECPSCGTFVSKKEGILSNGKFFCSQECLK